MKNVLAIDSSTTLLSICLKKGESYFEVTLDCGLKHSENLLVQIDHLLQTASLTPSDLDLLVTSLGPGSFTGLRIAMATIKGLSTGLEIPYVAVPTLDYLAYGLDFFDGPVVPVIDARKKRYYCSVFLKGKRITTDLDILPEEIVLQLKQYDKILFTGPDCMTLPLDRKSGVFYDKNYKMGKSRQMLELGLQIYDKNGPADISTGPVYLRKSEAEIAMFGE